MKLITSLLCVLWIFGCRYIVHGSPWLLDTNFDDKLPPSFVASWQTGNVRFPGACALACQKQPGCQGFFYDTTTWNCKMTSSVFLPSGMEIAAVGYRYYVTASLSCPTNGTILYEADGVCVQAFTASVNWTVARDSCLADQGRLLTLYTHHKADFFINYMRTKMTAATVFLLGGARPYSAWSTAYPNGQPDEQWLTGQAVDWTYYKTMGYTIASEPNNPNIENILILYRSPPQWMIGNNAAYNVRPGYICEHHSLCCYVTGHA